MRIAIIGQAPGRRNGATKPLDGPSGRRLEALMGVEPGGLHRVARLRNVLCAFPGKQGKGDAFPIAEARERAGGMRLAGRVLLAGKSVARAFGVRAGYFEWTRRGRAWVAVVPHPSGVNRWWNEPANRERAAAFFRGVVG